jgi:hypothetical protein
MDIPCPIHIDAPFPVTNFVENPLRPPRGWSLPATPIKTQYNTNF